MILRDRYGYPVETIFGKPVTNLIRRILHTNIRRTLAGKPLNEDEIAMKIKPTQSNVALAHSAFAGKTIYGDAAFPSVQTEQPHPELGSGALREALEQRIRECRDTAKRWRTESRNSRIDRAIRKEYSTQLDALASLLETALSLSSPIEPGPAITPQMMSGVFAKSVNNTDPEHDHVYDHRIAAAEINRLLGAHALGERWVSEDERARVHFGSVARLRGA